MAHIAHCGFMHETTCFVPIRADFGYYAKGGENPPLNAMYVAPEGEVDFNASHHKEHLPALAAVPVSILARRYRAQAEDPDQIYEYVAIYHLESADVTRSDSLKEAVDTPCIAGVFPNFRDRVRIVSQWYTRVE